MEQPTSVNLEVLEKRAERALEKMETGATGAREFAETMRDIRQREAHKEAIDPRTGNPYRFFSRYYADRWAAQTRRSTQTMTATLHELSALEQFEAAAQQVAEGDVLPQMPGLKDAALLRREVPEPPERVEAWRHHLESNRPVGLHRQGLKESIREYKTGVIERLEDEDIEVAEYPQGATPEERAYRAASELLSVAMDVTPEAAADSISPGLAETVAKRYEILIPWTRRFVAQLHLRSPRGGR